MTIATRTFGQICSSRIEDRGTPETFFA